MENCKQFDADNNLSENGGDDSSDSDSDQICDKPIDLKQTYNDNKSNQLNATNDSVLSKLVKSKAFSIKDILGLDESDRKFEKSKLTDERNGKRFFSEIDSVLPSAIIDSSR